MQIKEILFRRASSLGFDALAAALTPPSGASSEPTGDGAAAASAGVAGTRPVVDDRRAEIEEDVREALNTDDRQDRESGAIDCLRRYPYSSAVVEALLDGGWLAGRPIEAAMFAWDALNHIIFPTTAGPLVERLAEMARFAGEILPPAGAFFVPLRLEVLGDAIDELFRRPLSSTSPLVATKRAAVAGDELDPGQIAALFEAAQQEGDAEAAFLLEGMEAFPDEESRFEVIVALLESARELASRGFPTLASLKLAVIEAIEDDDEARRLMAELLLDQGRVAEVDPFFDESEFDDEIDDCVQLHIGFGARVAIERGDLQRANELLVPYFNGAQSLQEAVEMAQIYPELAVAAAELIMRTQEPNPLARTIEVVCRLDEQSRAAHRLRAVALFGQSLKSGTPVLTALGPLLSLTEQFPGYRPLWSTIATIVQQSKVPGEAYLDRLASLLERQPESSYVWYMIGVGLQGEARAAFLADYNRLLLAQAARCR